MVMEGLLILCASAALLADANPGAAPEERERTVAATLAVQTALEQGRDLMRRGEYRAAVYVLEQQLSQINGNRVYLHALQDAYRGHIKELRLANQDAAAETYTRRLRILDPGSALEATASLVRPLPAAAPGATPTAPATNPNREAPRPPAAPGKTVVRLQAAEDPAAAAGTVPPPAESKAQVVLARADGAFQERRYADAGKLYAQAHEADRNLAAASRARWAYCMIHAVVERMNQSGGPAPAWPELEREVRAALDLAPQLDFGKKVLAEIQKRQRTVDRWTDLPLRQQARNGSGWCVTESTNFRVYHNQTQDFAAQIARGAERTRAEAFARWFGGSEQDWNPKCDIILHANAQDYQRATQMPTASPGHSKLEMDGQRLVGRQVHLRCDHPNVLTAILPHETTHVVLAGGFTDVAIPRWADEGIAVLTEPREQVERHLRNLTKHAEDGTIFKVRELMEQSYQPQQEKYPEGRRIGAFYAQSISLVEYLTGLNGPQTFTAFLRAGLRQGYEPALQRFYRIRDFADLQQRWQQHAFRTVAATP